MKKNKQGTKEELILDLQAHSRKFFKKFGTLNVSRNYYRKHGKYSESNIEQFWPTFTEFKDESLNLTSQYRRVENDIVKKADTKKGRYFVTCAIEGSRYNKDFFAAILNYCKVNNAKPVVLWSRGIHPDDSFNEREYEGLKEHLVTEYTFSPKLAAVDFQLFPTQILPLTGLQRFGSKEQSLIVAAPKQHLESIPRPKGHVPHLLWSTGTISTPKYSRTRAGSLATQDNTLGGLIVEVEAAKEFYIRQVQYKSGGFVDLGKKYTKDSVIPVRTKAMVWGDLHATEEDPVSLQASIDQANFLKAESIFIHDICSLNSISHHLKDKKASKAKLPVKFNTLEKELDYTKQLLGSITDRLKGSPILYVVHSNHDDFIKKWLESGSFIDDASNAKIGAEMFLDLINDKNPLEIRLHQSNVHFLPEDSSFKIEDTECGFHGSESFNGGRGTLRSFGRTQDKIVVGHSHTPSIIYGAHSVGTNSKLVLNYNRGMSSWLHANAAIYEGGYIQTIIYIKDKWRA